jgi:ribosomal protein S18 acetylase RimI-like enzyme
MRAKVAIVGKLEPVYHFSFHRRHTRRRGRLMSVPTGPQARKIGYRPFGRRDRRAVASILYRTGFQGETLEGTGRFNDRRLFALVHTEAYVKFHSRDALVAYDAADGKVVGYVLGAADSGSHDALFRRRMAWRIALRAFLISWWMYPESFRQVRMWWKLEADSMAAPYYVDYPAHLHIDILPEYQRMGIGENLMRLFEERMAAQGVAGIHLITSNRNLKALPFYRKLGYTVLEQSPGAYWRDLEGQVSVVFAKSLAPRGSMDRRPPSDFAQD